MGQTTAKPMIQSSSMTIKKIEHRFQAGCLFAKKMQSLRQKSVVFKHGPDQIRPVS
jgi:hypothetical protein